MAGKYTKDDCIRLLQAKREYLQSQSITRYPQRSDFEEAEVVAIKAFLGPWPRALEAAELKPPRNDNQAQRTKEKRIRSRQRRNAALRKLEKERRAAKARDDQ